MEHVRQLPVQEPVQEPPESTNPLSQSVQTVALEHLAQLILAVSTQTLVVVKRQKPAPQDLQVEGVVKHESQFETQAF